MYVYTLTLIYLHKTSLIPRPAHLGMRLHNHWYAQDIQNFQDFQFKDFETPVARIPVARIQYTMISAVPQLKSHTFNITTGPKTCPYILEITGS